jgi:hypothetical protein
MYYYLLSSLKRRMILELQESFSRHPVYAKASQYIQNKFAFDERPQFGIVLKGTSVNSVKLSPQNFLGLVSSHVMLAYYDRPAYLLEWVKEDSNAVKENGDRMPIPSGVYYIECLTAPDTPGGVGTFIIDPLLTATDEPLLRIQSGVETEAHLLNVPVQGTLRIWENRNNLLLEGRDYTVEGNLVTFVSRFYPGSILTADYRYAADSIGPIEWKWNTADWNTLPGVILAFGKRGRVGDKLAVVVYEDRVDVAEAYGGKFEVSFDLDVIAQDPIQMEEMADYAFMTLWVEKRANLSFEGLEITDISIGGEAEETYDENADLNYYMASLSVQVQSDWEVHLPMAFTVSRAAANTKAAEMSFNPDREGLGTSSLVPLSQAGLFFATVPVIVGRNSNYERIT